MEDPPPPRRPNQLLWQRFRVPLKLACVVLTADSIQEEPVSTRDQTKCFAYPNTRVCLETGLNGGYYDVGVHHVSVVGAKTIVVIRNIFPALSDYLPHGLVPRNHEPQYPLVILNGHEAKQKARV